MVQHINVFRFRGPVGNQVLNHVIAHLCPNNSELDVSIRFDGGKFYIFNSV